MTSADPETMTALQTLLSERQRYEGWLQALEERKSSTPPHVFQRVYDDYTQRLAGVQERLAEHTEQVRATIASMTEELEQLRTRESDRIDERAEAELRAIVGEYEEDEWNKLREEADLEIEMMTEERQSLETRLAELQKVVDSTEPSADAASQEDSDDSDSREESATAHPESHMATATAAAMAAAEAMKMDVGATETKRAEGSNESHGGLEDAERATAKTSETRPPSLDDFVDWPARKDVQQGRTQPAAAQGDWTQRSSDTEEAISIKSTSSSKGASRSSNANTRSNPVTEPRRDTEKTLKCPECGALNYATEWYCERCGGELATF